MSNIHPGERDALSLLGTPVESSPSQEVSVRVRRLPVNATEEHVRTMALWSKELLHSYLLPADQADDKGFRSAVMVFKTMAGAQQAKSMLNGCMNSAGTGEMMVTILGVDSASTTGTAATSPSAASSVTTAGSATHVPARFGSTFQSMDKVHTQSNGPAYHGRDLASLDATQFPGIFSPQSPIGNHLASGKAMIANDGPDDDETSDLLNDPVGYAEKGPAQPRRATAPHLPIVSYMANLTINTNGTPGPSSVPSPYSNGVAPPSNGMSPMTAQGTGVHFPSNSPQFHGQPHFPPVNPADQNPPCNTLYVGNLPMNTTEAELKKIFMPQRGYKRLCFRAKHNGPMCFVEFEDITFATKALNDLYGKMLPSSVRGGIRLSFSKNPLGVRSSQNAPNGASPSVGMMNAMNGNMPTGPHSFASVNGPPPGLQAPPGLGSGRMNVGSPALNGHHHYTNGAYNMAPNFAGHDGGNGYSHASSIPIGNGHTNGHAIQHRATPTHHTLHSLGR